MNLSCQPKNGDDTIQIGRVAKLVETGVSEWEWLPDSQLVVKVASTNQWRKYYRVVLFPFVDAGCECIAFRSHGGACKHLRAGWDKVCVAGTGLFMRSYVNVA